MKIRGGKRFGNDLTEMDEMNTCNNFSDPQKEPYAEREHFTACTILECFISCVLYSFAIPFFF